MRSRVFTLLALGLLLAQLLSFFVAWHNRSSALGTSFRLGVRERVLLLRISLVRAIPSIPSAAGFLAALTVSLLCSLLTSGLQGHVACGAQLRYRIAGGAKLHGNHSPKL
jgi:hypothetical protein